MVPNFTGRQSHVFNGVLVLNQLALADRLVDALLVAAVIAEWKLELEILAQGNVVLPHVFLLQTNAVLLVVSLEFLGGRDEVAFLEVGGEFRDFEGFGLFVALESLLGEVFLKGVLRRDELGFALGEQRTREEVHFVFEVVVLDEVLEHVLVSALEVRLDLEVGVLRVDVFPEDFVSVDQLVFLLYQGVELELDVFYVVLYQVEFPLQQLVFVDFLAQIAVLQALLPPLPPTFPVEQVQLAVIAPLYFLLLLSESQEVLVALLDLVEVHFLGLRMQPEVVVVLLVHPDLGIHDAHQSRVRSYYLEQVIDETYRRTEFADKVLKDESFLVIEACHLSPMFGKREGEVELSEPEELRLAGLDSHKVQNPQKVLYFRGKEIGGLLEGNRDSINQLELLLVFGELRLVVGEQFGGNVLLQKTKSLFHFKFKIKSKLKAFFVPSSL